jgi:hypothetical protein
MLAHGLDGAADPTVLGEKASHVPEVCELVWSKEGAVDGIGEGASKSRVEPIGIDLVKILQRLIECGGSWDHGTSRPLVIGA